MKIFIIGGSGLVGSRIVEILQSKYTVDVLGTSNGVDVTDPASLDIIKNDTEHEVVILLAAKADVDGCEADKALGEQGDAWKINVGGVQNVVNACLDTNKKLIYISTDFVFDGSAEQNSSYNETDTPNPVNWYGMTKFRGEEIVKNSGLPFIIARIAYPYRGYSSSEQSESRSLETTGSRLARTIKLDFVRAIKKRLENNQTVAAVTDHVFSPTFIDDIAVCIDVLIHHNTTGIFHLTGSQSLTPYEAAIIIAEKFGLDKSLISKTTRAEYFKDKAPRPFNVSMNSDKIRKLGISMKTFAEGLEAIK